MRETILQTLDQLEQEQGFRVLYACESGSRAWGFTSADSDYDVRFIYAPSLEWYLRVNHPANTFERMLPGDLDVVGWELRKTLQLFAACNLSLNEWLQSPEVYRTSPLHQELVDLIPVYFNPKKSLFHYLRSAEKTAERYLDAQAIASRKVNVKKLFYLLRPIFACQWIVCQKTMPPTEYDGLLEIRDRWDTSFLPRSIYEEIDAIREAKVSLNEGDLVAVSPDVITWLQKTLVDIAAQAENTPGDGSKDYTPLNRLLYRVVCDASGRRRPG